MPELQDNETRRGEGEVIVADLLKRLQKEIDREAKEGRFGPSLYVAMFKQAHKEIKRLRDRNEKLQSLADAVEKYIEAKPFLIRGQLGAEDAWRRVTRLAAEVKGSNGRGAT